MADSAISATNIGSISTNITQTTVMSSLNGEPMDAGEQKQRLAKFRKALSTRSERLCDSGVTKDYKDLKEPDFHVCPDLLEINYYLGVNEREGVEYGPESNFSASRAAWRGSQTEFNNLFVRDDRQKFRHVSLIGGAGTGKTTLLKRYTIDVLKNSITPDGGKKRFFDVLRRKQSPDVHFIKVRELPADRITTPRDLLFRGMLQELDPADINVGYNWVKGSNREFLFAIDGLDQYEWALEKEDEKMGYDEEGTVSKIMFNLLTGSLFPNALVLTSSREHTIRFFRDELRAERIILLNGLKHPDIEYLVHALTDNKHEVWDRLSKKCPNLVILCMTPLFLIFTVIVFFARKDFVSDTLSGVMMQLIQCFCESSHSGSRIVNETLEKLQQLAYNGTMARKVIFHKADFDEVELPSDQANDFVLYAPRKTCLFQKEQMNEHDYIMFFCHQSVQEALTAMHVAKMDVQEYTSYLQTSLNLPHLSVVRRLICGVIANEEIRQGLDDILQVSDVDAKKILLDEALIRLIKEFSSKASHQSKSFLAKELLELLYSLYECGNGANDVIKNSLQEIDIGRQPLSLCDANVIGAIVKRSSSLKKLGLWDCDLDKHKLEVLWNNIRSANVKIDEISLSSNHRFDIDVSLLGKICHHCEVKTLNLEDCDLDDEKMKKFGEAFKGAKVKTLYLGRNPKMGKTSVRMIGRFIQHCSTENLFLNHCELTAYDLECFRGLAQNCKMRKLDFNYNRSLGERGLATLGDIVRICEVQELNLSRCNLSSAEIRCFATSLGESKMKVLDITTHELALEATIAHIEVIEPLLQRVTDQLTMMDWKIGEDVLSVFQEKLDSVPTDLQILHGPEGQKVMTSSK